MRSSLGELLYSLCGQTSLIGCVCREDEKNFRSEMESLMKYGNQWEKVWLMSYIGSGWKVSESGSAKGRCGTDVVSQSAVGQERSHAQTFGWLEERETMIYF